MMTRTQLSFDPRMLGQARERAQRLGISLAEYVRRLVAADLGEGSASSNPQVVFDLGTSSGSDIGADKDSMVASALLDDLR